METQSIYKEIAKRTGGDIYIGDAVIIGQTGVRAFRRRAENRMCGNGNIVHTFT